MQLVNERRVQPRACLNTNAVVFSGDRRIICSAVDVSAAGIALDAPSEHPIGGFVRVNFAIQSGRASQWHDADGVVTRVVRQGERYVWGVRFLVVEERVAGEIHDFVSATNHAEVSRQQVELYRRSKQRQRVSEDGEQDFEIKPVPPVPSAPIELESAIEPTYGVPTTAPRPGLAAVQAESEAALAGLATSQRAEGLPRPRPQRVATAKTRSGAHRIRAKNGVQPTTAAYGEPGGARAPNEPIDRELLALYLEALRQVEDPAGRKKPRH